MSNELKPCCSSTTQIHNIDIIFKASCSPRTKEIPSRSICTHNIIGTILNKQTRAVLLGPNNFSFTYEPGISDNNVFPGMLLNT